MIDGVINNPVAGGCWLIAGAGIVHWFYRRRAEARRLLYDQDARPTGEEAGAIKAQLFIDGFLGTGAVLALFLLLDWLF